MKMDEHIFVRSVRTRKRPSTAIIVLFVEVILSINVQSLKMIIEISIKVVELSYQAMPDIVTVVVMSLPFYKIKFYGPGMKK